MATLPTKPDKYERMRELCERLVGPRLLRPLDARHPPEVGHGGLLPVRTRYLASDDRAGLSELLLDDPALNAVIGQLRARTDHYLENQLEMRKKVIAVTAKAAEPLSFQRFREWYEHEADFEEWVEHAVRGGSDRGLYEMPTTDDFSSRRFPSVSMYVRYDLARIVFAVGANRQIKRSDLADAHHIAAAQYVDFVVSDDRMMRAAQH